MRKNKDMIMKILSCLVMSILLMSVVPFSTIAEDSGTAQSIKVIITNQDNRAITYHHLNDIKLLPVLNWQENIVVRKKDSNFVPKVKRSEEFTWCPAIPQDFNEYKEDKSSSKVWISVIDLHKGKVVRNTHLEPGESEEIISGLEPGRYLIRAGTTIQVDRLGEWDTGTHVPPEGGTVPTLPDPPLMGRDEYGSWECYHLAGLYEIEVIPEGPAPIERHYVYNLYKRYTYEFVASTITYVSEGEEDTAYVCLITDPNRLAEAAGSNSAGDLQILERQSVYEQTENALIQEMVSKGIEEVIKYEIPKASEKAAGVSASVITNLIYVCIDPKYDLEEERTVVLFGGSAAISLGSAVVAGSIGGPGGAVVAIGGAVVANVVLESVIYEAYTKGPIRKHVAEALFDDIYLEAYNIEADFYNVQITNQGPPIYNVYLGYLKPTLKKLPRQVSQHKIDSISTGSTDFFHEIPADFWIKKCVPHETAGWCVGSPLLVCDAEIICGSEKLEHLYWCIHDLGYLPLPKALQWLRDQQKVSEYQWMERNGEYVYWTYKGTPNVGVTALVTLAFLNHGYDESDPTVRGALNWLVAQANEDGSISCDTRKVYDTSLAILPLVAAQNEAKYGTVKANARNYLISVQNNEGTGYDHSDHFYGGWGYPKDNWADLSNTQFVVMALDASGGLAGGVKDNALTFVTRCQNRKESNSEYSSYDDGGFVYQPKSGAESRGSMTAAGLWGLFLCGVGNNDGRVQDALGWLDERSVEQNDPIGNKWIYYYDLGLAKAYLMAEARGCEFGKTDWYEDLYAFLSDKQEDDGHWHNIEGDNSCDVLATAEAILALSVKEVPERISRLSYMVFKLRSAADLHIYDPQGRHVGLNTETGEVEIGIPDATYTENSIEIKVPNLEAGGYKAVLIGTEAGEYELEVIAKTGNKTLAEASYEGWITEGATQEMITTISSIVGPLDVRLGTLEAVVEEEDSYSEQFSLDAGDELEIDAIDETGVLLRIEAEEDCECEVKIRVYSENPTIKGFPGEYKYCALEKYVEISLDVDKEKIDWPIYLEVHYDDDELPENVDESTLTIYHYLNDTKWRSCNDFEVNPEENYISAELEEDELCYFGMGGLYAPIWERYSMILAVIAIVIVLALGYFSVRRFAKSRRVKTMKVPERVPAKVAITIYNFDNSFSILKEREETAKISDGLDGRLASGEIKEETYNDLKSKYESKISDLNRKIKSELERAKAYLLRIEDEQTKLQRTHESLNAELQKEKGRKKKAEISAKVAGISAEVERVEGIIRTMKEKIGVIEGEFSGD